MEDVAAKGWWSGVIGFAIGMTLAVGASLSRRRSPGGRIAVIEFLTAFGYVVLMVIVVAAPIWFLDQL